MTGNFYEEDVGAVLSGTIRESEGDVFAVNPTRETVPDLVFRLHDIDDPPTVRLLATRDVVTSVMDDFIVAGHAADLVDAGALSIRLIADPPQTSLYAAETMVVSLVEAGDRVGGLTATEPEFVADVWDHYADRWDEADEYQLRTPALSRVRETLAAQIGTDASEDFDAILDELAVAKGDGEGLDEVTIAILVAARSGELLYDISKWGEDVELASKATFSRSKSRLEDVGIISTEKVPIDVGRPRLRLRLDEDLRRADIQELTATTKEVLHGAE